MHGLLKLLIELFQTLWPFLKESWLKGESFPKWLRRNKSFLIWLVMIMAMGLSILVLMAELSTHKKAYSKLNLEYNQLLGERKSWSTAHDYWKKEAESSQIEIENYRGKVDEIAAYLERCDIPIEEDYVNAACPAPKVQIVERTRIVNKRGVVRTRTVVVPVTAKRETFRERMKRIFGNKESK